MQNPDFNLDPLESRQHLAATLLPAQSYTTALKTTGAQKNWTIPLVAGRNITLAAGDLSGGNLETELILIAPNGKAVRRSVGSVGSFISYNAPVTGNYRVRLRDVGRNDTGSVKITAFYYANTITDSDDAFSAQSGRRFAATVGPGDLDVWTLSASSNQFLSALATENTVKPIDIGLLLIDPTGQVVGGGEDEEGVKFDIPRSAAGNYYAVVYDAGANDTGVYGISFGRAPGEQYGGDPDTSTPLQNNVSRNGDMPGGDMDIWSINLTQGQTFTATLTRTTGSLDPELLLIAPDGSVINTVNGSSSAKLTLTVPSTGSYWLLGRDREADDGGKFSIKYTAG